MGSWDFWSVVSLVGIFQAILLLAFVAFSTKDFFPPNVFIFLLLIWLVWIQVEFLVIRRSFVIHANLFFGSRHGVWLLLGPLVYHYVSSLFSRVQIWSWKTLLHYFPFLLFVIILPMSGAAHISERIIGYGMLSVLKFPMLAQSWSDRIYGYVFILQFAVALAYLIKSMLTIMELKKELRQSSSDNRQEKLGFLIMLVAAMGLITLSSIIFISVLLTRTWYVRDMDFVYILPLTLCAYLLSFFAIRQPKLFVRGDALLRKGKSGVVSDVSVEHFARLKELILKEKLYLNPELRLIDLSEISQTTPHQISQMINTVANVSFFEFINQFRIDAVISTINAKKSESKKINILEIAYASGFNNKVSFNRYFKKQTGLTPSAYIQEKSLKRG